MREGSVASINELGFSRAGATAHWPQAEGATLCPWCGAEAVLEVFDAWQSGEFLLETCCEMAHEVAVQELREGPKEAAAFMRASGIEGAIGLGSIRRVLESDFGTMVIDWNPRIVSVRQSTAKQFVREHHEHCPPPAGWKFGAGVVNGAELIGVVMVGRPVARMLDDGTRLEVNRVAVRRDMTPGLTWNACSMLYAAAAKEARKLGYRELITYTLDSESAVSLKASGWQEDGRSRGGGWSRPSRPRLGGSPTTPKRRWVKRL